MKTTDRQFYVEPLTNIIKVKYGGVVCVSGNTEQFGSGNSYGDVDFD